MLLSTQHHAQSVCDLSSSAPRPAGAEIGYIIFKCAGYACGCVYGGPLVPDGEPVDTFSPTSGLLHLHPGPAPTGLGFSLPGSEPQLCVLQAVMCCSSPSLPSLALPPPPLSPLYVCMCAFPSIIALLMETRSFVIATKNTIFHQITRCSIPESTLVQI